MNSTCDRFKIVNRKGIRVDVAIPSYKVKRVIEVSVRIDHILFLDEEFEISLFIEGFKVLRLTYIPFTKRGMLHQLAKFISVAIWGDDRACTFYNKKAVVSIFKLQLVNGPSRYYKVVTVSEIYISVRCF